MTLKLILVSSWPGAQHYLDRPRTGWLSVRIMRLEWDSRSLCWWPDVPVRQDYGVTMSVHCHKSEGSPPPLDLSHNCETWLHTSPLSQFYDLYRTLSVSKQLYNGTNSPYIWYRFSFILRVAPCLFIPLDVTYHSVS